MKAETYLTFRFLLLPNFLLWWKERSITHIEVVLFPYFPGCLINGSDIIFPILFHSSLRVNIYPHLIYLTKIYFTKKLKRVGQVLFQFIFQRVTLFLPFPTSLFFFLPSPCLSSTTTRCKVITPSCNTLHEYILPCYLCITLPCAAFAAHQLASDMA